MPNPIQVLTQPVTPQNLSGKTFMSPIPLKNISQLGVLFPIYGKIKHVPNHHPDNVPIRIPWNPLWIFHTSRLLPVFCCHQRHHWPNRRCRTLGRIMDTDDQNTDVMSSSNKNWDFTSKNWDFTDFTSKNWDFTDFNSKHWDFDCQGIRDFTSKNLGFDPCFKMI